MCFFRLLLPAKSKDNIGHCTFEVLVVVVVEVMVGEYQMSDELRVFFLQYTLVSVHIDSPLYYMSFLF